MRTFRLIRSAGILLLAGLVLVFTPALRAAADEAKAGSIAVSDAWARATSGTNGAVYAMIHNNGDKPDRLVGVSTSVAAMAHLHQTVTTNGVSTMHDVDGLDIPAHGMAMIKPGGYHLMLMGLARPLAVGQTFPVTLKFEHAGEVTVQVTVKPAAGAASSPGTMDDMDMGSMK